MRGGGVWGWLWLFYFFFFLFPSFSLQPVVGVWLGMCMEAMGWLPWGCKGWGECSLPQYPERLAEAARAWWPWGRAQRAWVRSCDGLWPAPCKPSLTQPSLSVLQAPRFV